MSHDEITFDEAMMRRCILLAKRAQESGNTAVGSVITEGNEIIVEVEEQTPAGNDIFAHAELAAVREACRRLGRKHIPEATLYTTAEPCLMCSFAIREAQIARVVIGTPTQHIGGIHSNYPILTAKDVETWTDPPIVVWSGLTEEIEPLRSMLRLEGDEGNGKGHA